MSDYTGIIIEESLADRAVLGMVTVVAQKIEVVTERHQTPWVKQWTLDMVRVPEAEAEQVAAVLSEAIDTSLKTSWYADYKNDKQHYIIFPGKIFAIDRTSASQYQEATDYGISLGIPPYQVDFSPHIKMS